MHDLRNINVYTTKQHQSNPLRNNSNNNSNISFDFLLGRLPLDIYFLASSEAWSSSISDLLEFETLTLIFISSRCTRSSWIYLCSLETISWYLISDNSSSYSSESNLYELILPLSWEFIFKFHLIRWILLWMSLWDK